MENRSISEIIKKKENIKFKSSLKQELNNNSLKLNLFQENTKLSNDKNYKNELYLHYKFKILENFFQILKSNIQKNKLIFEKIKFFLYNKENINNNLRKTIFPFDLKKEIFIDKLKANKKKEEYYKKCKNFDIYNNLRNKLFNKNVNYISKTHNNNNSIIFYNNSSRYKSNFNSIKINDENESIYQYLNNYDANSNFFMERTTPFFYYKNNCIKNENFLSKEKIKSNNNLIIYEKKGYFQNRINKNERKGINSFSKYNYEYFKNESSYTPYIIKINNNFNSSTKITKNNYKNTNNIFLSDNLEDYQMETYNPKNKYNLYSNYLINNKINTERNIYKKNYSLTWRNRNITSTISDINNIKLKEFEINFNNKSQLPFASLKKNLKKEFINFKSNNYYIIRDNCKSELEDNSKNKLNNKYITYNNIININDPKIIHKDINLIKNDKKNTPPKIQTYLIYFKEQNKNLYKEDMIYHRPKSSSKFSGINKTYNLGNI